MIFSVPDFSASRVLAAGDLMPDRYWLGPTRHRSPEAPAPIVRIKKVKDRAGGAANVAINWVIAFSGDTPLRLIETIKSQGLETGGDYHADEIVGAAAVRDNGGIDKVLSFKERRPTTELIAALRKV